MKKHTRNQHYIPSFILRNFCVNGKMQVADLSCNNVRYFQASPESICLENDLYETINPDGSYYHRNELERKFASIEQWLAPQIAEILTRSLSTEFKLDGNQDGAIALLLALQLTRMPKLKQLIESNNRIGVVEKNFLYKSFVDSNETAIAYATQNGVSLPLEMQNKQKTLLDEIASFILSNCFFYVLSARLSKEKFFVSDNPVLITPFEDAQYIFPISPDFALGCCTFKTAKGNEFEGVTPIDEDIINKINRISVMQSQRFVIGYEISDTQKDIIQNRLKR